MLIRMDKIGTTNIRTRKERQAMKKLLVTVTALLAFGSMVVAADDYYVEVTNSTGYVIYELYVSPESSDSWEEDVLGEDILLDGESVRVDLYGYESSIFDIMAVDEDGDTYTFYRIDVYYEDLDISIGDMDF